MTEIAIALPDEVAQRLQRCWGSLPQGVVQLVLVEAYRLQVVTRDEVGTILGLVSPELDALLGLPATPLNDDAPPLRGSSAAILAALAAHPLAPGVGRTAAQIERDIAAERESWE
jgi:hypothetical protein